MQPITLLNVNFDALDAAFETLQERHEILHMCFSEHGRDTYVVLNDTANLPVRRSRLFNPFTSMDRAVLDAQLEMSSSFESDQPHWRAQIIERREEAAVICLFSSAIADTKTVALFREELLDFYNAYCDAENPEQIHSRPVVQFLDTAVMKPSHDHIWAWWDTILPVDVVSQSSDQLPVVAPTAQWDQAIPKELADKLKRSAQELEIEPEAFALQCFCDVMRSQKASAPDWIIYPFKDRRPQSAKKMLGPFTKFCPVWLGDLEQESSPADYDERIRSIAEHGAVSHEELHAHMGKRVPDRIACYFEFDESDSDPEHLSREQDVNFFFRENVDGFTATWSVRLDHPLSTKQRALNKAFLHELKRLLER